MVWRRRWSPAYDHSRYAVAVKVVPHATGRAVCTAFAEALIRYGIPQEMLRTTADLEAARRNAGRCQRLRVDLRVTRYDPRKHP